MKSSLAAVLLALAGLGLWALPTAGDAGRAPAPAPWELEVRFGELTPIQLRPPGETETRTYWFLEYIVINRTGEDRTFVPEFTLFTNTGLLTKAGRKVPKAVFQTVQKTLNEPLLRDTMGMTGKILQGEDNAKRGAALFEDFDREAGEVDIFVGGLTDETVTVRLPKPVKIAQTDLYGRELIREIDHVVLSRTKLLHYALRGNLSERKEISTRLTAQGWVLR